MAAPHAAMPSESRRRAVHRLDPMQVVRARPPKSRRSIMLADGGNLYLQVSLKDDGRIYRSWIFRYTMDGQTHDMGLGNLFALHLTEARGLARELRQEINLGINPLAARNERKLERRAKARTERARPSGRQNLTHTG